MHTSRVVASATAVGLLVFFAILPSAARAGQFTVASCQADRLNFSTAAFSDFATRGMRIRRACNPEGRGIRGLVTANSTSRGSVPRGSVAMVAIAAPAGTRFTTFRWAGSARRRDCRYALQLYAAGPGVKTVAITNVRANHDCPRRSHAQAAGYRSRTFNVAGTTRIVQRVICKGGDGRRSCSARGVNYIRTYKAEVGIADYQAPIAAIAADTPLAAGAWVGGVQPLHYNAADNVGVRSAAAIAGGQIGGSDQRSCALANPEGAFADAVPCPNGVGAIDVDTRRLPEGSQQLVVQVQDTAGNLGNSAAVVARIDNTAPARVDVGVAGGELWRNTNDFTLSWANPPEGDRAPIAAAIYKICAAGPGNCTQAEQAGSGIASLPVRVPSPGQWTVSLWRRDAAGNADPAAASVPVTLRYDPEPPQVAFESPSPADPTLVAAQVIDRVSGLADGTIELSRTGSNVWQVLATEKQGSRLVARIDDAVLPAGSYVLRAIAHDQAHNEGSTTQRLDGQPMAITLPLRIVSAMRVGVAKQRVLRRVVRRHGKRHTIRRRVTVLKPSGVVRFGRRAEIHGQLTNRDGQGIGGTDVQVFAGSAVTPEQLVGVVHTDASGRFTYTAAGSTSRTLRFTYGGSPLILPTQGSVRLVVPATSSLHVSRRRVLNGQKVMFHGRVRSLPLPPGGKLVQLEVRLSNRWQTFRTARTDTTGRWAIPYRFARTRGIQHYRFRVELPAEAGYPFSSGASKSLRVRVRGL